MRRRITRVVDALRVWLGWDSPLAGGLGVRVPVLAVQPAVAGAPHATARIEQRRG